MVIVHDVNAAHVGLWQPLLHRRQASCSVVLIQGCAGRIPSTTPDMRRHAVQYEWGMNESRHHLCRIRRSVIHEHIDWEDNKEAGQQRRPARENGDITAQSDLRLYNSDKNSHDAVHNDMGDVFGDVYIDRMGQMMKIVPVGVSLRNTITPMAGKPITVSSGFHSRGRLSLLESICRKCSTI